MRAGQLRHRVTLEQPAETVTGGNATVAYTTVATVWADIEGLAGRDIGVTADVDYRVRIRHRTDVSARWRIGLVGTSRKLLLISPPVDPDGRRRELVMTAKEVL